MSFQAEVKQLLHLMIHSLYSNKEIFLRELVSNASDAADKLRFEGNRGQRAVRERSNLRIRIGYDKAARTITIDDNGIGMSRDEAIANLGTIARSGTKEFFTKLSGDQQKDAALIGQFGVGFYSGFIVADKITVETRRAACRRAKPCAESAGEGDFTIDAIERAQRDDHAAPARRRGRPAVVAPPEVDHPEVLRPHRAADPDAEGRMGSGKGEMVLKDEDETVNQASALWTRSKSDVTDEQYTQFYQHIARPWIRSRGRITASRAAANTQLLFVPSHAPFDLWNRDYRGGLKLYVKRVFIMDDAEQLLPQYLRFVKGVVDSADLPLNVSREILQESRDVKAIREGVTKRALSMLEERECGRGCRQGVQDVLERVR